MVKGMTFLFITNHLSTCSQTQTTLKRIEHYSKEHEVYLIEYEDVTGNTFVSQKNIIKNILSHRLITLSAIKRELLSMIDKIRPDVVYIEEFTEYFMDPHIAKEIYNPNRNYSIVETTHLSDFYASEKTYQPDKIVFLSNYQYTLLKKMNLTDNVAIEVEDYPIEFKEFDKKSSKIKSGWDPSYRHVLCVGLFSPKKNYEEVFKYAESLINEKVIFHIVGNRAPNFEYYWKPLINNQPTNLISYGEISNIALFYEACDLFLYPALDKDCHRELLPISVKDAIGYNMPVLMYNQDVYMDYFTKYENVHYLHKTDFNQNINKIKAVLGINQKQNLVII
jgi:glycosyltransferase involved in cell wall biosynthesis